jgi:hypothetical protein
VGQPVDERAKADALDDAANAQTQTLDGQGSAHRHRLTLAGALRKRSIPPTDCGIPAHRRGAAPMPCDRGDSKLFLNCTRRLS